MSDAPRDPRDRARPQDRFRAADPSGYRVAIALDDRAFETLTDIPPQPGRLLFVGLSPSPVSVAAGHYHQDRAGRAFWRRLIRAQVLPEDAPLNTADEALAARGHGLTDLVKLPAITDAASDASLRAGVGPLWQKIALWRPAAVVFIEHRAASACAGRPVPEDFGPIDKMALAGRPCILMPGPSAPRADVETGLLVIRNLVSIIGR